jgi:hypothetical protein
MSEKPSLLALGERAVLERSASPLPHARPTIAVVDRLSARWAADTLVRALEARGAVVARVTATLRAREGSERVGDQVRASPDAMGEALAEALAALPSHDVLVAEGPAAVALLDTRLAILASPVSVLSLAPDVRALRASFDLVLFAERAAVLALVAAELA